MKAKIYKVRYEFNKLKDVTVVLFANLVACVCETCKVLK